MAFYGSKGEVDESYWTPYSSSCDYDFAPPQIQEYSSSYGFGEPYLINSSASYQDHLSVIPQLNYSFYTISEPQVLHSEPIEYHSSYDYYQSSANESDTSYSYHNYNEPKLLQYQPTPDSRVYVPCETKFRISYSTVEFNEPEFEEYDPTPYGGGYDPTTTYGKPLPPSDTICYPRSTPKSDSGISLENFSYGSIPSPYGKTDDPQTKPPNVSKPIDTKTDSEANTHVESGDKVTNDIVDDESIKPSDVIPDDESESSVSEQENEFEGGTTEVYGYDSGMQVSQNIPYGSGLEAMDICESLFGYWPCLAKRELQEQQRAKRLQCYDRETRMDPWKSAGDYLFGTPLVYDYENYHHHQQQA